MDSDLSLASRLGWEQLVRYETVNGHTIAVAEQSPEAPMQPPLLLLHGFPTCAWDFYKIWPQLAAKRTVLAPDFLGFGLSDKPVNHDYKISVQADICEIIVTRGSINDVEIVAHDYGTTVAQELLARQSEGSGRLSIGKAVFLNGGFLPEAYRPRPIQKLLAGPVGSMVSKLLTKRRFTASFTEIFGPDSQPAPAELTMLWDFMTHNNGHRLAHKQLQYMAERETNRQRWVPPILHPDLPLLLINGHLDPISGKHLIDTYRGLSGKAKIIDLPNIGHYPQLEAAEEVGAAVMQFLEEAV